MAELHEEGLLLKPMAGSTPKLSWEATARAMSEAAEEWSEWSGLDSDGLEMVPWDRKRRA